LTCSGSSLEYQKVQHESVLPRFLRTIKGHVDGVLLLFSIQISGEVVGVSSIISFWGLELGLWSHPKFLRAEIWMDKRGF